MQTSCNVFYLSFYLIYLISVHLESTFQNLLFWELNTREHVIPPWLNLYIVIQATNQERWPAPYTHVRWLYSCFESAFYVCLCQKHTAGLFPASWGVGQLKQKNARFSSSKSTGSLAPEGPVHDIWWRWMKLVAMVKDRILQVFKLLASWRQLGTLAWGSSCGRSQGFVHLLCNHFFNCLCVDLFQVLDIHLELLCGQLAVLFLCVIAPYPNTLHGSMWNGPLLICTGGLLNALSFSVKQQRIWLLGALSFTVSFSGRKKRHPATALKEKFEHSSIIRVSMVRGGVLAVWGGGVLLQLGLHAGCFAFCCDMSVKFELVTCWSLADQLAGFPGQHSASIVMAATQTPRY